MISDLKAAIHEALKSLDIADEVDFVIEHPTALSHGDYACNVAMVAAKVVGKDPRKLAEAIVAKLNENKLSYVTAYEVAGPGFINVRLGRDFFKEKIATILEQGDAWGRNDSLSGKRIMVEYTQPNPFKVFHIGHLMSNAIGEALSRIIEANGADVFRANYQGDVGLHIGKALWGLKKLALDPKNVADVGRAYAAGHEAYENDESSKKEIIDLTKAVYAEDESVMGVYREGREASLTHFAEIYMRVGTTFDALFFESETWKKGKEVVEAHMGDVFEESEGAIVYRGEQDGLHTRVFINSEGVTTYEAKDVGLAYVKRERWPFDLALNVTAVEQDQYFKVVFRATEKTDSWFVGKLDNLPHGMMQLQEGKMSSRKGNVISGEAMLNDARDAAARKIEENKVENVEADIADMIGVAALKYMILKQSLGKNIAYDLERALSFEGDSGPYLQYTNARINSVLDRAGDLGVCPALECVPDVPYPIERLLYRFPEVVGQSAQEREPHHIVTFLIELSSTFNTFYAQEKIADTADECAPYKAAVAKAVGQTLRNGLYLLGINAPNRM